MSTPGTELGAFAFVDEYFKPLHSITLVVPGFFPYFNTLYWETHFQTLFGIILMHTTINLVVFSNVTQAARVFMKHRLHTHTQSIHCIQFQLICRLSLTEVVCVQLICTQADKPVRLGLLSQLFVHYINCEVAVKHKQM